MCVMIFSVCRRIVWHVVGVMIFQGRRLRIVGDCVYWCVKFSVV